MVYLLKDNESIFFSMAISLCMMLCFSSRSMSSHTSLNWAPLAFSVMMYSDSTVFSAVALHARTLGVGIPRIVDAYTWDLSVTVTVDLSREYLRILLSPPLRRSRKMPVE